MSTTTLHRTGSGSYVTDDGFEVLPALDGNLRRDGWHLLIGGEWAQTFPTLGDARDGIAAIRLEITAGCGCMTEPGGDGVERVTEHSTRCPLSPEA